MTDSPHQENVRLRSGRVDLRRVAVLGGSGFVGSYVVGALVRRGHVAAAVPAPRLPPCSEDEALHGDWSAHLRTLEERLKDYDVIVNAAGLADPAGHGSEELMAANGALPAVVAAVAGGRRVVHISSGAVQGSAPELDSAPAIRGFSPYSHSKVVGEITMQRAPHSVVYRPAGVHGPERSTTITTVRLARSAYATVAAPGRGNSPVALVDNVADAVAHLATCEPRPPSIVHHPSEGISVSLLMQLLGGKAPRMVPRVPALLLCSAAAAAGRVSPWAAANSRRLQVLWFGQKQAPSWLEEVGWEPYRPLPWWRTMAEQVTAGGAGKSDS